MKLKLLDEDLSQTQSQLVTSLSVSRAIDNHLRAMG